MESAFHAASLAFGVGEGVEKGGEFEDFDLGRAVGPIVAPSDDYVTTGKRVWEQEREGSGLAGFAAKVAEHGVAEEGVGAGLVALALAAKPGDDVGVEAEGELLLDGAIEGIAGSVPPKLVGERWDVRKIDRAVGLAGEFGETAARGGLP